MRTVLLAALVVALMATGTVLGTAGGGGVRSPATSGWSFAPHMAHRRSYTASTQIGDNVYVAAGMVGNTGRPLNLFERFDARTDQWTSLPLVPRAFSAAAGAALNGRMYVIGGNGTAKEGVDGRQVFIYDVQRRHWSQSASLPAPRTNLAAVALGGKVYAVGGLDPVHATRTVFVYEPARNRWSRAAPLPQALHALAAVALHGEIWVIGGQNRSGSATDGVWIYDPRRDRWRAGPRLPTAVETAGAAAVGERIYVVLESVYMIYDTQRRQWTRGPRLEVPRHALSVFAVKGTLYAIGGCAVPQLEDSSVVEKIPLP